MNQKLFDFYRNNNSHFNNNYQLRISTIIERFKMWKAQLTDRDKEILFAENYHECMMLARFIVDPREVGGLQSTWETDELDELTEILKETKVI